MLCPIALGYRIRRLHCCRVIKLHHTEGTCLLKVVIHNAYGRDPGGLAALDTATKGSSVLQHTTLALTFVESDKSAGHIKL